MTPNLTATLNSINKDFADIQRGLTGVVRAQRFEARERMTVQRYKANKVSIPTYIKNLNIKNNVSQVTDKIKSGVSTTAGIFSNIILFLGAAGLAKILLTSDTGKFFGKFISSIFEGVVDFFEKGFTILKDVLSDSEVIKGLLGTISSIISAISTFFATSYGIAAELIKDPEVLKDISRVFTSIIDTLVSVLTSSYDIIKNLFSQNTADITKNFNNAFADIAEVFSNLVGALGTALQDPSIVTKVGEIIKASWELLVEVFSQEWTNPQTGKVYNPWIEAMKWVGEAALVVIAVRRARIAAIQWALSGATNNSICDCGPVGRDDKKTNAGRSAGAVAANEARKRIGGVRKGPPLEKIANARKTKLTIIERVKFYLTSRANQIVKFVSLLRYRPSLMGKLADIVMKIGYRIGANAIVRATTTKIYGATVSVVATFVGYVATPGGIGGIIMTIVDWVLWGALAYDIWKLCVENMDEINGELESEILKEDAEKEAKEPNAPVRLDNTTQPTNNVSPVPGAVPVAASTSPSAASGGNDALSKVEAYLGRKLDSKEWDHLQRAVYAEGSGNEEEYANIMAVILNRARKSGGSISDVLWAGNAFQSVTGTKENKGPSPRFQKGPFNSPKDLQAILNGANKLDGISKNLDSFTAANTAAYKEGTKTSWLEQLKNAGGKQIGGTIFAENMYGPNKGKLNLPSKAEMQTQMAKDDSEVLQFKKDSLVATLLGDVKSGLAMLDKMTGGKLIQNSSDFDAAMRNLEEDLKNQNVFMDMSNFTAISQNIQKAPDINANEIEQEIEKLINASIS